MSTLITIVSENVRRLRREKGLSQLDLSQRMKVTQSHLSRIENGTHGVSLDILERLSVALEVPTYEFVINKDFDSLELKEQLLKFEHLDETQKKMILDLFDTFLTSNELKRREHSSINPERVRGKNSEKDHDKDHDFER